tara:strand:- start:396 stop:656 length:261 start_codon:yes stop_codon:yes gene_type:complete
MALTTKNGQIHIPSKTGKQKGLVSKHGQISTLIPYVPADVIVADRATYAAVSGVELANLSRVMGVTKVGSLGAAQHIDAVMGVDKS